MPSETPSPPGAAKIIVNEGPVKGSDFKAALLKTKSLGADLLRQTKQLIPPFTPEKSGGKPKEEKKKDFSETRPVRRLNAVEPNPGRNMEKEDFENTAELLEFTEENSGFLPLDHPLTQQLQEILDKTQDPNAQKTRLLIALNESESNAFCLPDDTLVLNMSSIHDLDYVEEVVAILAHEQGHSEKGHLKNDQGYVDPYEQKTLKGRLKNWIRSLGHGRKAEYQADFVSLAKLDSIGSDTTAFASAIRKLGRRNPEPVSYIDFSHGSPTDRALNSLYAHALIDYPSSAQGVGSWHAIPAEWKIDYQPSKTERMLRTKNLQEWRELVADASPLVLTEHIREVFYELRESMYAPKTGHHILKGSDHVAKVGLLFDLLEKRIQETELTPLEKNRAVLLGLTESTGIPLNEWRYLYGMVRPGLKSAIVGPISHQSNLVRAQHLNINRYITYADKTPEGVIQILDLSAKTEIYQNLGLTPPKSPYPAAVIDHLADFTPIKDGRRKAEGAIPAGITSAIDNLVNIGGVITDRFGQERGQQWLQGEIDSLVRSYIEVNRQYDNLLGTKLLSEKTAQLLEYINNNTAYNFNLTTLDRYAQAISWGNQKSREHALSLFREKIYRPDPKLESILSSSDSAKLQEYLIADPENFNKQLAVLYNRRPFTNEQRLWVARNLTLECLAGLNLDQEVQLPKTVGQEISKLPFGYQIENFSDQDRLAFNRIFLAAESLVIISSGTTNETRSRLFSGFFAQQNMESVIQSLPPALNHCLVSYLNSSIVNAETGIEGAPHFSTDNKYDLSSLQVSINKRLHRVENNINADGNRLLELAPFQVLAGRMAADLREAPGLEASIPTHTYINTLVGRAFHKHSNIWGMTPEAAVVLSPFLSRLFTDLNAISLETAPTDQGILLYTTLREKLPQDLYTKGVVDKLFSHLILNLPLTEALNLLEQEAVKRRLDFKSVDRFIEERINTRADFALCRDSVSRVIDQIMQQDDTAEGRLVLADVVTDALIKNLENPVDILKSMMESSRGDSQLRSQMAPTYWDSMAASSIRVASGVAVDVAEFRGWEVVIEGNKARVEGPGAYLFHPFNDLISRFYQATGVEKNLILRKVLLQQQKGALVNPHFHKDLAAAFTGSLKQDGVLTPLFGRVVSSAIRACDPIRIFQPLSGSLADIMLQAPEGAPNNQEAARALHSHIYDKDIRNRTRELLSRATNTGLPIPGLKAFLDLSRTDVVEGAQERPETRPVFVLYENMLGNVASQVGYVEPKPERPTSDQRSPIDVILNVGQGMGPVGKRFLQVAEQYMDLEPEQSEKFREVYDSNPGQSKFTTFSIMERLARTDDETQAFLDGELVSVDKKKGAGSIVTTWEITTKDADGNLKKEILKVKNPNAERYVIETVEQSELVINDLLRSDPGRRQDYEMAGRMLRTIRNWVLNDINDPHFLERDAVFHELHHGFTTSEGVVIQVPETRRPNNLYLQREELAEGPTVNSVITEANSTGDKTKLRRGVRAGAELLARSLTVPAIDVDSDSPKYLVRSDIHPGNDIVSETADRLSPIDRRYYLVLDQADVNFVKSVLSEKPSTQKLSDIVHFMLDQPENQGLGLNPDNVTSQIMRGLAWNRVRNLNASASTMQMTNKVMGELDKRGIEIPERIRLMFKNLGSENHQLQLAELGSFTQYLAA